MLRRHLEQLVTTLPPERLTEALGANFEGNRMVTPGVAVRMGGFGAHPDPSRSHEPLYLVLRVSGSGRAVAMGAAY